MLVWKAPVDTASHGLWKNGKKEINFTFCFGTAYDLSSMEDNGNYRLFSLIGKAFLAKQFYTSINLWDLAPLQISASLCEGPIYLLLCWIIILLLKSTSWRAPLSFAFITVNLLGMTMTGSLLPWITMFSQSLIFRGALHLCFAVSERASEIPSCYIMLWLFWESVVIRDLLLLLASWLCHWYE